MMYWNSDHMSGWGYATVSISMVVFWGLVIFTVIMLIRYVNNPEHRTDSSLPAAPTPPERLLAERYARGEINEEEYRTRRDTLRDTPPRDSGPHLAKP